LRESGTWIVDLCNVTKVDLNREKNFPLRSRESGTWIVDLCNVTKVDLNRKNFP
jgi:hypothetical protein